MIFSGVFTFLVDAYPLYAASALAANSFSRSMFAAAFPLFGQASECALFFGTLDLIGYDFDGRTNTVPSVSEPWIPMGRVSARHDHPFAGTISVSCTSFVPFQ